MMRHESQIHEVMMANLQEFHQDDKITRASLNQVTESRNILLAAAHDLQAQLDSERVSARQRIIELGESAARSSSEADDHVVNLGSQEIQAISAERDRLLSELIMAADDASRNKDTCKNEILRLKRHISTLQYEGIEEMKHLRSMDEINQRKLMVMTPEEREDYKSQVTAQESFINTLRAQLQKANEDLGKQQQAIVTRKHNPASSTDQRMAEMKMNILEESVQRKEAEALTERLQDELMESNAIEAQLHESINQTRKSTKWKPIIWSE